MIRFDKLIKYLKTLAIAAGVFLLVAILSYFLFRNQLLNYAFKKFQQKAEHKFSLNIHADELTFNGLNTVSVKHFSALPSEADTLISIQSVKVAVEILPLLIGKVDLSDLLIEDGYIQWQKTAQKNNLSFLKNVQPNKSASTTESGNQKREKNIAGSIYRLTDLLFDAAPDKVNISRFSVKLTEPEASAHVYFEQLTLAGQELQARVLSYEPDTVNTWQVGGILNLSDKRMNITVTGNAWSNLPFIRSKFTLQTGFGIANFTLNEFRYEDEELRVSGKATIRQLRINHPKIATKDVVLPAAEFNFFGVAGKDFVVLDSLSYIKIDQLTFSPFFMIETAPDTIVRLSVVIPRMPAQHFVNALPEGLFNHIKGMEVDGNFDYRLDLVYNENKPQDLIFESVFHKYNLDIRKYGQANLGKLNEEFVHVPLERGRPVRPIVVGVSNPYFTPLSEVSPYLKACVLTTEDPSFFYHRGFIDEAFKQSIIKNIRTRKFARGASTISMQLVKNVFLTREKTLSRKLEEILLVYIIENNRIATKERMLEVYFNIIEWGPNVYGIGEAAEFYFNKKPSQLNLSECMFLATIIPRPKGFMWRFDKKGIQKEFVGRQYKFLTGLMVRRNVLIPQDTVGFNYQIPILGRAKSMIKIAPDTTMHELQFDENGILKTTESED
ncbi:MAG: transglycosylase domain-containing protein [Bacteroidota bacterium]